MAVTLYIGGDFYVPGPAPLRTVEVGTMYYPHLFAAQFWGDLDGGPFGEREWLRLQTWQREALAAVWIKRLVARVGVRPGYRGPTLAAFRPSRGDLFKRVATPLDVGGGVPIARGGGVVVVEWIEGTRRLVRGPRGSRWTGGAWGSAVARRVETSDAPRGAVLALRLSDGVSGPWRFAVVA